MWPRHLFDRDQRATVWIADNQLIPVASFQHEHRQFGFPAAGQFNHLEAECHMRLLLFLNDVYYHCVSK